jgi:DNA invertase Pin-like site-specific DNA recombinase
MKLCYKRVSSADQNLERQLHGMEFDREYVEKVSGKNMDRPELKAMLLNVREGDEVHVHEMSRGARDVRDLLNIVETVTDAGGSIKFHKENLEFKGGEHKDAFQSLMLNLLGAISQFERDLLLSRQREGIALAKARGAYKGRQSKFTEDEFRQMREDFKNTKNKAALAKRWGISRAYLYRVAKES